MDKAAQAYARVITRYPMAPHVEDARDRLVAMNRPVPEPTQEAVAENDAEERSHQPLHFTDKTLDIIKHGPTVVEAVARGRAVAGRSQAHAGAGHHQGKRGPVHRGLNAGRPPLRPPVPSRPPAQRAAAQRSTLLRALAACSSRGRQRRKC